MRAILRSSQKAQCDCGRAALVAQSFEITAISYALHKSGFYGRMAIRFDAGEGDPDPDGGKSYEYEIYLSTKQRLTRQQNPRNSGDTLGVRQNTAHDNDLVARK